MSVVGIDLGTLNSVVAIARNRGVDVIVNEASSRATPSMVSFAPKQRYLGESAKTKEISNYQNTVSSLTRLAGRKYDETVLKEEQGFVPAELVDVDGEIGAEVTYLDQKHKFKGTQLVAMFLTQLKNTAYAETKNASFDLVLSCPAWYTDAQRRSLIDACDIAGLKLLRLINDTTASALGWGIPKTDLPTADEKPRRVAFIDIGHSNYTATIVEFRKGELAVKATAWDRKFGGRYIDEVLFNHFAKLIKEDEKFQFDVKPETEAEDKAKDKSKDKARGKVRARLWTACEALKKRLSANTSGDFFVESIPLAKNKDDTGDFKFSKFEREQLEELLKDNILSRATAPIERALAEAKMTVDDIDDIEMVGGSTRVPALKSAIQSFFGKPLSFTLNQDEAVARGAAFSCAILSPSFRVRDFSIHDIVNYPIEFSWEKTDDIPAEDTSLTVFSKGNVMPSTKILTFYRKRPFAIEAKYVRPELLPTGTVPWIGNFSVKGVKVDAKDDFMICKLKARLNLNGVLNVEQGYYVEDQEVEEPIPNPKEPKEGDAKDDAEKMEVDDTPKTRKVKKQVRKGDLSLHAQTSSLDRESKAAAHEQENQMFMQDKLVVDTDQKKNDLESFVYDMEDKLEPTTGIYAPFCSAEEKAKVVERLADTKNWLDDDGFDAPKAKYIAKFDEIRSIAGPIIQRYNEKAEAERMAKFEAAEKRAAAQRAEEDSKKPKADANQPKDVEMKDAADGEAVQPTEVEEPAGK